jgi:hypothetical protein
MPSLKIVVHAYSGYRACERPARFELGERSLMVRSVLDRWYGPDYEYFKVRADDGNSYILKYDGRTDSWELEFFEKKRG